MRTDTKIKSWTEGVQKGVYKYPDGTEVPYTAELLDNGGIKETVAGTTLRWEGSQ